MTPDPASLDESSLTQRQVIAQINQHITNLTRIAQELRAAAQVIAEEDANNRNNTGK